jgi:hypothetical protein
MEVLEFVSEEAAVAMSLSVGSKLGAQQDSERGKITARASPLELSHVLSALDGIEWLPSCATRDRFR